MDNKNVGAGKNVSVGVQIASATSGAIPVFGYTFLDSGTATSSASAAIGNVSRATISAVTGITAGKTYDGSANVTASTAVGLGSASFIGMLPGDNLAVGSFGAGSFSDKNAGSGKTVVLNGVGLGGADAANYLFAGGNATGSGNISALASATWIGNAGDLWSNAANWNLGAVPEGSNVLAVVIPAGTGRVVFDAAAGTTSLQSLQSERPVALSGGNLQIAGLLKTTDYNQSGGALSGSGTLDVNGSFTQSAGSIALGAIDITQASGNLTFTNLGAPVVKLSAPTGAISHSGALAVASLATTASAGITLSNSANKIGALSASNTGTGDILIVNSIPFSLLAVANRAGNIDITNLGAITTSGPVVASVGNIFLTANSPLTIGAGGVAAGGDIVLTASNLTSAGDMTLNGPITSGGKVILDAGNNLQQNSTVLGALGVTARAGGRANFGPFATSNNSPISYSAGGASIDPPPTRLGASEVIVQETAKQVDVIVTFLDQFQKAVDEQRAGGDETNPDGSKKKDLEAIVTEGEVCK